MNKNTIDDIKIKMGISSLSGSEVVTLDNKKNIATYNGLAVGTDARKYIQQLFGIIGFWDNKMVDDSVCDGLSYFVYIKNNGKNIKYQGKNKFPFNFNQFLLLINEVKNG